MKRVLVTDGLQAVGVDALRKHGLEVEVTGSLDERALIARLGEYEGLIVRSATKVTRAAIAAGTRLEVIGRAGAGVDTIDVDAATERGIIVMNTPGGNTTAVAEHTLALLLALARRVAVADATLKAGKWEKNRLQGVELLGKTLGILGLGRIGGEVARRALGFRMQVLAYDPYLDDKTVAERGATKVELDELLRRADFVSINCPLDDGSRGMIGARQFGLMQKHAYFITTARGLIHDEKALEEALRSKAIAGAGLDVWSKEPPEMDHPLLQYDNVIASPHTAGVTREARANMGQYAAEQLVMILDGKRPPRIINPDVWPAYAKRFERTFGMRPA